MASNLTRRIANDDSESSSDWLEIPFKKSRNRVHTKDVNLTTTLSSCKLESAHFLECHFKLASRPNALQQLFDHMPPDDLLDSPLFIPILNKSEHQSPELAYVKAFLFLYQAERSDIAAEKFKVVADKFVDNLDNYIEHASQEFIMPGYYIAIINSMALFLEIGNHKLISSRLFINIQYLSNKTLEVVLQRPMDPNVLSYIYVILVFMDYMSLEDTYAMNLLEQGFPWNLLVVMLNGLVKKIPNFNVLNQSPTFSTKRYLPEDSAMCQFLWASTRLSSPKMFSEVDIQADAMAVERAERILWLACHMVRKGSNNTRDERRFSVVEKQGRLLFEYII